MLATQSRSAHSTVRRKFKDLGGAKNLGPKTSPGGGGRFRAYVLDSESGGAKSRYPKSRTANGEVSSRRDAKKFKKCEKVSR